MPVPSSIDDLSTTAGSNSPSGTETPGDGDNYIRALSAFIATLRDKLDGTSPTGTITKPILDGTATGVLISATLRTTELSGTTTAGYILTPAVSAVIAYRSASTSYAVGTNTLVLNTKIIDRAGNYDATTGIFTAPRSGIYEINASLRLQNATLSPLGFTTRPHFSKNNSSVDPNVWMLSTAPSSSNRLEGLDFYYATGSALFNLATGDTLRIKETHTDQPLTLQTTSVFSVRFVG